MQHTKCVAPVIYGASRFTPSICAAIYRDCELAAVDLAPRDAQSPAPCRIEARWRSGDAEDCKSLHPGSIPGRASSDFALPVNSERRATGVNPVSSDGCASPPAGRSFVVSRLAAQMAG